MSEYIIQLILLAIGLVFVLFFLKLVFEDIGTPATRYNARQSFNREAKIIEKELQKQAEQRSKIFEKVSKYSREHPGEIASILNKWLINDNGEEM